MKIKEVCERTGLTRRAVRFYEEKGLISPELEPKEHSDYRDYSEEDLRRLQLIARLRTLQLPVSEVAAVLEAPEKAGDLLKRHARRLEEEGREKSLAASYLNELDLRGADNLSELSGRLGQADHSLQLPMPDIRPDFGRMDDLTAEERRELERQAAQGVRRQHRLKRRRLLLGGVLALTLAAAGLALGLWIRHERAPLCMTSSLGMDFQLEKLQRGYYYGGERTLAAFSVSPDPLGGEEPLSWRVPLSDGEAGYVLERAMFSGETYMGIQVSVSIPRCEARERELLAENGFLDAGKVEELLWTDPEFTARYSTLDCVYADHRVEQLP